MTDRHMHSGDPNYIRYSTLRDWIGVCFRQRRLVIICFCGMLLGTSLLAWLWAARYYESSMQVLVMPDRMDSAVTSSSGSSVTDSQIVTEGQINSEMALLQGTDLLRQVVASCNLSKKSRFTDAFLPADASGREQARLERSTRSLARALRVEVEKQADVIDVSFGAVGSRETPACVLSELSKLYLQKRLQLRRPPALLDFFSQQTDKYQQALGSTEDELADFGTREGAVAPDLQRTLVAQKLIDAETALRATQQTITEGRQRLQSPVQQLAATSLRVITQEHDQAAGELLQQLEPQVLAAKLRRDELAMKFSTDYPSVKEADREVADAEGAVASAEKMQLRDQTTDRDSTFELLRQDVAKTRADVSEQAAGASELRNSIRSLQEQAVVLDQKALQFQGLQRDAKANEENYLLYLSKREQERSAEALDDRRIANVAIAEYPTVPILPAYNPLNVLAIGVILAVILSAMSALVGEYLNGSFRTPADVADALGVTILASVPKQAA